MIRNLALTIAIIVMLNEVVLLAFGGEVLVGRSFRRHGPLALTPCYYWTGIGVKRRYCGGQCPLALEYGDGVAGSALRRLKAALGTGNTAVNGL